MQSGLNWTRSAPAKGHEQLLALSLDQLPHCISTVTPRLLQVVAFAQQLGLADLVDRRGSIGGSGLRSGQVVLVRGPAERLYATEEDLAELEFTALVRRRILSEGHQPDSRETSRPCLP